MDLSILIPTYGRADKLGRCLERLARQDYPRDRFEVLVGVDGRGPEDESAEPAAEMARRIAGSIRAVIHEFDHAGPAGTRNRLARHARGKWLLLLNDDVLPEADLLSVHVREQQRVADSGGGMVLGAAPWLRPQAGDDTLFDRLIRETSMVFFYDRMESMLAGGQVDADHDWGYRHAWTLNLSLERAAFEAVGGFDERLTQACYEDLEFAYRLAQSRSMPVRYAPAAVVHHDHRLSPDDYLRRERMMGRAAWTFAAASPQCAMDVFGRDIRSRAELDYSRQFVSRESATVDRLRETFRGWLRTPAESIAGPYAPALLRGLYEQHLLLKRWTWRAGLIEAAG